MKLFALTRNKQTKEVTILESEYPNKKSFKYDIRANGLELVRNFVYTESEWETIQTTDDSELHQKLEWNRVRKQIRARVKRKWLKNTRT